jgi:hypothetical protein
MLRRLIEGIIESFTRENTAPQVAFKPIMRIWHIELGTIEYGLALQSLIPVQHKNTPRDHVTFTDNGDLTLAVLYEDLKATYSKEIRKEQKLRLKGIT